MPMDYKQYQEEVAADVAKIIADASCQPILFIGSGFTKRYAKGPNWEELLGMLAKKCPQIDKDFAYYKQAYGNDLMKIGSVFSQLYHEWGWNAGKKNFPPEYFAANAPSDIFIKHVIGEILAGLGPDANGSYGSAELDSEIAALNRLLKYSPASESVQRL